MKDFGIDHDTLENTAGVEVSIVELKSRNEPGNDT